MPSDRPLVAPQDPVEDLIYRFSHDLRASTRAIAQLPSWISEDLADAGIELPDGPAESFALLQVHTQRLDDMIQGLLALSRAGMADQQSVALAECLSLARDTVEMPKGALLRIRCDASRAFSNETDLMMAVGHLLSNAVVHHPATPHITVLGRAVGDMVEVWVRDNGPGIPVAQRENVLKPMVKLQSRDDSPGPGMGLAIVDKIARKHGGSFDIFDPPHGRRGTAVRLRLPIAQ